MRGAIGAGLGVIVSLDARIVMRDGRPASHLLTYERMWKRYLDVFDEVTVVARYFRHEDGDACPIEGPGVRFVPVPAYSGPVEYLLRRRELHKRIEAICSRPCAYILRTPGGISAHVWQHLRARKLPYALEVVGDPSDVFAPGVIRHPLRPALRYWIPRQLRLQCLDAVGAAYVTEHTLQRRYPCPAHMASYSSVELPDEAFAGAPRSVLLRGRSARLVFVGDVNQLYKGPHVLIDAVARCVRDGWDLTLTLVGAGSHLPWLRERASACGIGDRVEFTGRLPGGEAVRRALDRADLFVLPSYCEGLPRAMIEAMARGLPCIGSAVGGFGELLAADELIPPGDAVRLATTIGEVLGNPTRMSEMSARNLERASQYNSRLLRHRRMAFYQHVRDRTMQELGVAPAIPS